MILRLWDTLYPHIKNKKDTTKKSLQMTEIFLFLQSENSNYFLEDFFVEEEVLLAQLEELFLEDEELFLQEQEESCSTAIAQC